MIAARRRLDPAYNPPWLLNALTWMFLDGRGSRVFSRLALRVLRARP